MLYINLVRPKPFWTDQNCFGHIERTRHNKWFSHTITYILSDGAGTCLRCNTMQSYWELNQQIGTLLPSLSHNQLGIQIHPNANVQGRFLKLYTFLKPDLSTLRILLQELLKFLKDSWIFLEEFFKTLSVVSSSDKIPTKSFLRFFLNISLKLCRWSRKQQISSKVPDGILAWMVGILLKKPDGFLYFFTSFFQPRLNLD